VSTNKHLSVLLAQPIFIEVIVTFYSAPDLTLLLFLKLYHYKILLHLSCSHTKPFPITKCFGVLQTIFGTQSICFIFKLTYQRLTFVRVLKQFSIELFTDEFGQVYLYGLLDVIK